MEMPRPNAEHERLARFAGTWTGTETMYPSEWDPKGGEAQATTRARVGLDGFAVIGDYEQRRGGKITFQGHSVLTFDMHANDVVLHWFDSMGMGLEQFRGRWNGDRIALQSKNPMGFAKLTHDFGKPKTLRTTMETSRDGKTWAKMFDGVYTRSD